MKRDQSEWHQPIMSICEMIVAIWQSDLINIINNNSDWPSERNLICNCSINPVFPASLLCKQVSNAGESGILSPTQMHGFTAWGGGCVLYRKKPIWAFIGSAVCFSCLDTWLLLMMVGTPLKGAEPRNDLPITESQMNMTGISNVNISELVGQQYAATCAPWFLYAVNQLMANCVHFTIQSQSLTIIPTVTVRKKRLICNCSINPGFAEPHCYVSTQWTQTTW